MCAHRNPMSLFRLRSQSHQSIPTHMLNIVDNQRDAYDSRVCLYCPSGVTGLEIHLILECPATSHVALILSNSSQPSSMTPANQIGAPSPPANKPPLSWVTPHQPFPKKFITCGCNQPSLSFSITYLNWKLYYTTLYNLSGKDK